MLNRVSLCILLAAVAAIGICACREKAPPPPKLKRQDIRAMEVRERSAVIEFVRSLEGILEWRQTLPAPMEEGHRLTMVDKLQQVPVPADLPEDLAKAWRELVDISKKMRDPQQRDKWRGRGAEVAAELNRQLATHGYSELRF